MGLKNIKDDFDKFKKNLKRSRLQREKIENEREREEYIKRQERYNDMLRDETQKQKFINNMNKIKVNTYTKKMVAVIIIFSILCITTSYVLAFLDKSNTLEGLSTQLCITILGVSFVYMIRAYFDSKAEHKNLDNKIKEELEEGLVNKMSNMLSEAGLNINMNNIFNKDEDTADEERTTSEINPPEIPSAGLHYNTHNNDSVG